MGNTLTLSCYGQITSSRTANALMVKLIFYGGETRILMTAGGQKEKKIAGEIMFEFPDHMVCHADSFFIGHPIPALAIDDELIPGQTYFVLPLDCFVSSASSSCAHHHHVLSVSSLASLGSRAGGGKPAVPVINNFRECPLQYVRSSIDGRILIKVMPEFMIKLIMNNNRNLLGQKENEKENGTMICSTPELKKHYEQLVGCTKVQGNWSPKLETISEYKIRYSPCRFLGFERKLGEP